MLPSDAIVIAVMGVTGVGKSTFIQYATGAREGIAIGDGLESCTSNVTMYQIPSTRIFLLDTPGFDDTYKYDTEILSIIADFLEEIFEDRNAKLQGIIYIHAITEPRMKGSSMRNLRMFRKIIGDHQMKSCCLVTTKWSLQPFETSAARERELLVNPQFWQPIKNLGAAVARFADTTESARSIIDPLLSQGQFVTKLTQEFTVGGMSLGQTEAGREVKHTLEETEREHEREIEELKRESKAAIQSQNQELAAVMDADRARLEKEIERMKADRLLLDEKREQDKQQWEKQLSEQLARYQDSLDKQSENTRIKEIRRRSRKGRWRARAFGAGCVTVAFMSGGAALPFLTLLGLSGIEVLNQVQKEAEDDMWGTKGIPE